MLVAPVGVGAPQSRGFIPGAHFGIDYAVPVSTPILASADGTVIYRANEPDGYGNTLTIDHGGPQSRYAHLSAFFVGPGDRVSAGQVIGLTGGAVGAPGAGNSTGPHLHYEYRTNPSTPIDPAPLFGADDPEEIELMAAVDTIGQWLQDTEKRLKDTLGLWMQEQSANTVKAVNAHVDARLDKLPAGGAGGLTDAQVRAIVRDELDKTKLTH